MTITQTLTDRRVLAELGERLGRARLDANQTQAELAQEAGISKRTLERLEAGHSTQLTNLLRVLRALGLLDRLDTLVPEAEPSPVQQLRLEGRTRERASPAAKRRSGPTDWTWDDDP
jgi:transcriptional regulator with XRE-family HTH domain